MKPIHESTSTVITSPQQRQLINELASKHLDHGGSMFAQVFPDGLRLRVLTPAQTQQLQAAISDVLGDPIRGVTSTSAFQRRP